MIALYAAIGTISMTVVGMYLALWLHKGRP